MSRKAIRLIALLLCLASILTILPLGVSANDGDYYGDGGGYNSVGATGGWREWTRYRAGYRVYVVDADGQMASNAIDYVFQDPFKYQGIQQFIWGTKVEGMNLSKSPNKVIKLEDVINTKNNFSSNNYLDVPVPVTMNSNGVVEGHGTELKKWLTNGYALSQLSNYNPTWSKTTTTGNYKQSSNKGGNAENVESLSNVDANKIKSRINAGLMSQINLVANSTFLSQDKKESLARQKMTAFINGGTFKAILKNNGVTNLTDIANYKAYANAQIPKLIKEIHNFAMAKKNEVPSRIEQYDGNIINVQDDGSLMVSFAAGGSAESSGGGKVGRENFKNLFALMNLKGADGKYILQIYNNEAKGLHWFNRSRVETASLSEYFPEATIMCNPGLVLMIEPISWIAAHDPYSGATYTRVYGTYTNINEYYKYKKGLSDVLGYNNIFNGVGPTCLRLDKDLVFENGSKISKVSGAYHNCAEVAKKDKGYALHAFVPVWEEPSGVPEQKTYDPPNGNLPNPEHPAPDPEKIKLNPPDDTPETRVYTIVKTYVELVNDTMTEAQIQAKGGESYLRTVYDGHEDGWYERHVTTYERLNNPSNIRILHEKYYEVIEYITSREVRHPEDKNTTWGELIEDENSEDGIIDGFHKIVDMEDHTENIEVDFIDLKKMPKNEEGDAEFEEHYILYVKLQRKLFDDPEEPPEAPPITIDAVLHESQLTKAVGSDSNYEGAIGNWKYQFDGLLPSVTSSHTYTTSGSHSSSCPEGCTSSHSSTHTCNNLLRANGDNHIEVEYVALWGNVGGTMYEAANTVDGVASGLDGNTAKANAFRTGDWMNIVIVNNRSNAAVTDQRSISMPKTVTNASYHHPDKQPYVYMTLTRRGDYSGGRIDTKIVGAKYKLPTIGANLYEQLGTTVAKWDNTSAGYERSTWKDGTRSVDTKFSFAIQLTVNDGDVLAKCPTHSGNEIASQLDVWVLDNGTKTQDSSEVVKDTIYKCKKCGRVLYENGKMLYSTGLMCMHPLPDGSQVNAPIEKQEVKETKTTGARIYREGNLKVEGYAGEAKTKASKDITNLKGYSLSIMTGDGAKFTKHTSHVAKKVDNTLEFYPYIRMSFMYSMDANSLLDGHGMYSEEAIKELKDNGVTNRNRAYLRDRTTYVLSDKKSQVQPTNAVEISWYNDTQANNSDGIGGINITSQQWSVHKRATDGSAVWKKQNSVLPGGAIYQLDTQGQESWIQTNTYFTVVKDEYTANGDGMTIDNCVTANQEYIKELKDILENYNLVQWVGKDFNETSAWSGANSVKINGKGISLNKLGLSTKSSTEDKHVLFRGTVNNANGAAEADLDITQQAYQTQVFKCFTNTEGRVYVAILTQKSFSKNQMDKAQLDKLINELSTVDGAAMRTAIATEELKSDYTLRVVQIGEIRGALTEPVDSLEKILNRLKDGKLYTMNTGTESEVNDTMASFLYQVEMKTGFISNTVNSVTRGKGNDYTAAWVAGNAWYNEAYDGFYVVKQSAVYKLGLSSPSKRVSVLDPNLCPPKANGTSSVLTNAFISQFRVDSQSNSSYTTAKAPTQTGYMGTFAGMDVYLEDIENLMTSRPFYIPNANVQDLS